MDTNPYSEIKKHIEGMRIIDTHEHLPPENERTSEGLVVGEFTFTYPFTPPSVQMRAPP